MSAQRGPKKRTCGDWVKVTSWDSKVKRDGGSRGKVFTKTETLLARTVDPSYHIGFIATNVELVLRVTWCDQKKGYEWHPEPFCHPSTKGRVDLRVHVKGLHYFHRLVAYAYANTPGISWEEYQTLEGGVHVWQADHLGGLDQVLSTSVEVVTREENQKRELERKAARTPKNKKRKRR